MKQKYLSSLTLLLILFVSISSINAQERIAILQEPFVVLLDPNNGSIVDPTFIDLTPLNQGTPKGIIQVNEEIWISDQIEDRIDRFDLDGNYIVIENFHSRSSKAFYLHDFNQTITVDTQTCLEVAENDINFKLWTSW